MLILSIAITGIVALTLGFLLGCFYTSCNFDIPIARKKKRFLKTERDIIPHISNDAVVFNTHDRTEQERVRDEITYGSN